MDLDPLSFTLIIWNPSSLLDLLEGTVPQAQSVREFKCRNGL